MCASAGLRTLNCGRALVVPASPAGERAEKRREPGAVLRSLMQPGQPGARPAPPSARLRHRVRAVIAAVVASRGVTA
jgi:hypothetical protein